MEWNLQILLTTIVNSCKVCIPEIEKISWVKNFKKSHYLTLNMAVNLDMTRLTDWNSDFLTVIFPILVWGIISRVASPGPSQCRLMYYDSNVIFVPWSFQKQTHQSDEHSKKFKTKFINIWQDFERRKLIEFLVQV